MPSRSRAMRTCSAARLRRCRCTSSRRSSPCCCKAAARWAAFSARTRSRSSDTDGAADGAADGVAPRAARTDRAARAVARGAFAGRRPGRASSSSLPSSSLTSPRRRRDPRGASAGAGERRGGAGPSLSLSLRHITSTMTVGGGCGRTPTNIRPARRGVQALPSAVRASVVGVFERSGCPSRDACITSFMGAATHLTDGRNFEFMRDFQQPGDLTCSAWIKLILCTLHRRSPPWQRSRLPSFPSPPSRRPSTVALAMAPPARRRARPSRRVPRTHMVARR